MISFFRHMPLFGIALIALSSGCRHNAPPIPKYALQEAEPTLAAFTARSAGIESVQATAVIEMTDAKKQSVHLDAALLLQSPDKVRLRAWKFGTAVFDLTVNGDKAWAYVPREEARPAMPAARQSITQWLGLLQGRIDSPQRSLAIRGETLIVESPSNGGTLRCTIDRPTLTAKSYELFDDTGKKRFTLGLSDYVELPDRHVWPMTITATSEQGIITVHSGDVSLNEALPETAFKPPARAEALP